jgi:kynurenine formamidase
MQISITVHTKEYHILNKGIDISIPLNFNGLQPNTYGVDRATSHPFKGDGWVGDVREGGSCNFEVYNFIPHCNGTHTECVGHITEERISIHEVLQDAFIPATLVTLTPEVRTNTSDTYIPALNDTDLVIDKDTIEEELAFLGTNKNFLQALIIRTLPNEESKKSCDYTKVEPPFFTIEAMKYIKKLGVKHLLIDIPSVDRLHDEGKLTAHHIFWGMELESKNVGEKIPLQTITEFIYVPEEVVDGIYMLNLQIAPFMADASPSRPRLYPIL